MNMMEYPRRFRALMCLVMVGSLSAAASELSAASEAFANREVIQSPVLPPNFPLPVGVNFEVEFTSTTPGADERIHVTGTPPDAVQRSHWFSWTAPESGWHTITTRSGGLPNIAAVYQGTSLGNLSPIGVSRVENIGARSAMFFEAVAGEQYEIVLAAYRDGLDTTVTATLANVMPGANRYNEPRLAISVPSTVPASFDADTVPGWSGNRGSRGVWFRWVTPEAGMYQFSGEDLPNSGYSLQAWSPDGAGGVMWKAPAGARGAEFFEAVAGEEIYFEVTGRPITYFGGSFDFDLRFTLDLAVQAENDDFANALPMQGREGSLAGSTILASSEEGEQAEMAYGWDSRSVWWYWTAPEDGLFLPVARGDLWLGVFTGSNLANLQREARGFRRAKLRVTAGEKYFVRIAAVEGGMGSFNFDWDFYPVATNDEIADAIDLGSGEVTKFTGSTVGAGFSSDEPAPVLEGAQGSVWYRWETSEWAVAVIQALFPGEVDIFRETGSGVLELVPLQRSNQQFAFAAELRTSYLIRVTGWDEGVFSLSLETRDPVSNDDFENAIELGQSLDVQSFANNLGATGQPGEGADHSIWWHWTAPKSTRMRLTSLFHYTGSLKVFTGDGTFDGRVEVLHKNLEYELNEFLVVEEGREYWISLDVSSGETGDQQLNMQEVDPEWLAPNTYFVDATDLGNALTGGGDFPFGETTTEAGEPLAFDDDEVIGLDSVWWTWTAPETTTMEVVFIARRSDDEDVFLAVWKGDSFENLEQIAGVENEDMTLLRFSAEAGTTYRISAGAWFADGVCLMVRPASPLHHFLTPLVSDPNELGGLLDVSHVEDGVTNLEKFIFGLDPMVPVSSDSNAGNLPAISMSGEFLELRYRVRPTLANDTGSVMVVGQCSTDGLHWEDIEPEDLGDGDYVVRTPIEEDVPCKLLRVDYRIMELGLPMRMGGVGGD